MVFGILSRARRSTGARPSPPHCDCTPRREEQKRSIHNEEGRQQARREEGLGVRFRREMWSDNGFVAKVGAAADDWGQKCVGLHLCCLVIGCCVCVCYLFINLQKLLHSYFLVPGYPEGSVDAPEAASSTVLVEEQVLMLYLHKRRARGRHGILTHTHTNTRIHAQQHTHTRSPRPEGKKKCAGSTGGAASKSIQATNQHGASEG